jgi:hypothetical protein
MKKKKQQDLKRPTKVKTSVPRAAKARKSLNKKRPIKKVIYRPYQGKEFTTILQADSFEELDALIDAWRDLAERHGIEDFKVLKRIKDPDGGYKAIVVGHNFNAWEWVKDRVEDVKHRGDSQAEKDRIRQEREERRRQDEEARTSYAQDWAETFFAGDEARREAFKRLPYKEQLKFRKKYEDSILTSFGDNADLLQEGVPSHKQVLYKVYKDGGWVVESKAVPMSRAEQLELSRESRLKRAATEMQLEELKELKRQKSTPAKIGRALNTLTALGVHTVAQGVAGAAMSIQPGPSAQARAAESLAPRAPMELYTVMAPNPQMDLSPLRRGVRRPRGSLGYLRKAMFSSLDSED